jgi:hypothetical protein
MQMRITAPDTDKQKGIAMNHNPNRGGSQSETRSMDMRMNKMNYSRGCPSVRRSLTSCRRIQSVVVAGCLSWGLLLSALLAVGAEEEGGDSHPSLQPAVPIAQRMERRRTVLLLGDILATEPLSGEAGGTLNPDPLSSLEQRHASIRMVDRRRPPNPSRLPPGLVPRSVGGVAGLRSRLFGELYDLRLGEVAAVLVQIQAELATTAPPEGPGPEKLFQEILDRVAINRKTSSAAKFLVLPAAGLAEADQAARKAGWTVFPAAEPSAQIEAALVAAAMARPEPDVAEWFEMGISTQTSDKLPVCTAGRLEGPPVGRNGGEVSQEGRRVILDGRSYPRPAASFVQPPSLERQGQGWLIRFSIDRSDDVAVRVVDGQGKVVCRLGAGVLGAHSPEPFAPGLEQTLAWDGLDAAGAPVGPGGRIEVGLGLTPSFQGFIGQDTASLMPEIVGVEVDPQGRVYTVNLHGARCDPTILRYERNGTYVDMVLPSDPGYLPRPLQRIYPFACSVDGQAVPTRPRAWPYTYYLKHYGDMNPSEWRLFPFRVDTQGQAWFAEVGTGLRAFGALPSQGWRVLGVANLDQFFFRTPLSVLECMGGFAVDNRGHGYLAWRANSKVGFGSNGPSHSLNAPERMGTILKIHLASGKPVADFRWNGREALPEPRAWLGVAQVLDLAVLRGRKEADSALDSDRRFADIRDLAVDGDGRILVSDGWPRRIKCYASNGAWLGEAAQLNLPGEGEPKGFLEITQLRAAAGRVYLLAGLTAGRRHLVVLEGAPLPSRVCWLAEVSPQARGLAVDERVQPPVIWIGNGAGPGSLLRLTDGGARAGESRTVGGRMGQALIWPGAIAVGPDGRFYAHDEARQVLVATDIQGGNRREIPMRLARSLLADPFRDRLLVSAAGKALAFDRELRPLPLKLTDSDGKSSKAWLSAFGGQFVGCEPDGSILVRDAAMSKANEKGLNGLIQRYGPDGRLVTPGMVRLWHGTGGGARDSRGNLYAMDLCLGKFQRLVHDFPFRSMKAHEYESMAWLREGNLIRHQSELGSLACFGPGGGDRGTESEHWAHRGFSIISSGNCKCDWPAETVAVDAADRIFASDADHFHVKALDNAGNLIARIGRWGNAQTQPQPGGPASELGFDYIYALAAAGDDLYVCDRVLRRVARLRMDYRTTAAAVLP